MSRTNSSRFATYVWAVLATTLLVILWGAVVRATGSGAGCGAHWPLCNGEVIPQSSAVATLIEFVHRLSSGLILLLIIGMVIASRRMFAKGHPARTAALVAFGLIVVESLIGMLIVVQELTAKNDSALRAAIIAVHQANTLLLLGAITLTGWLASVPTDGERINGWGSASTDIKRISGWSGNRAMRVAIVGGVIGLLMLGATGAITALGDTLFPAASLAGGLQRDFSAAAHFLERLRVVHPVVAALMGVYVVVLSWLVSRHTGSAYTKWLASSLTGLFLAQGALGSLNVVLLAPVWTQLMHLLMADLTWVWFVLLAANVWTQPMLRNAASTWLMTDRWLSKIQNQKS